MKTVDPWTLIGWAIVAGVASFVLLRVAAAVVVFVARRALWLHSRRFPVAVGQHWTNGDVDLYISNVYDNGMIGIRTAPLWMTFGSYASWGESPEEWRARIDRQHLWMQGGRDGV